MSKKETINEEIDLGGLTELQIDNAKYSQMWNDLIQVDGFSDYLQETMALDMKRYFYTSKESQERVKGHFDLAHYLYKTLIQVREKKL